MPKQLLERLAPDSVQEFRAAAILRASEAELLAGAGFGAGAIHLWGYSAEMIIKAAYFSIIGFSAQQRIGHGDLLLAANNTAAALGVVWPPGGKLHNIECWCRLLVAYRNFYHRPYAVAAFQSDLLNRAALLYRSWRETLRYHKNRAYAYETMAVKSAAKWFLAHSREI